MRQTVMPNKQEDALRPLLAKGYRLEECRFATGRPDRGVFPLRSAGGVPVVAKLYPDGLGEKTFTHMQKLWRSSFGERRHPPGLPRPLDFLPEAGALILERLQGRPLLELGAVNAKNLEGSIQLLAALHNCEAQPEVRRTSRGIIRSIQRKVALLAQIAPQHHASIAPVLAALERARPKDSELVPSHGDFSPRNVLASEDRLVLIDWDRFQFADPARDVAYFAIHGWRADLRRGQRPDRSQLKRTVKCYESLRPGADLGRQLRFHVAAGLVRMACSLVQLWPDEAWLVPALGKVALEELRAEKCAEESEE